MSKWLDLANGRRVQEKRIGTRFASHASMARSIRVPLYGPLLTLGVPLLISVTVLPTCLLVRAREPNRTDTLLTHAKAPAPISPANFLESTVNVEIRAAKTPQASSPVMHRAPICEKLVAKIVSDNDVPELSMASLSLSGAPSQLVKLGSRFGRRQVVGIAYDRGRMSPSVYLLGDDGLCQAMTFEKSAVASERRVTTHPRAKHRTGTQHTEILVERTAVNAILERAFELTRGISIAPKMKEGTVVGMGVFGIRQDSLLSTLGLENGDTIERINGVTMNSPEAALSLYTNIRSFDHFDIEVTRAGLPTRVEIRVN